MDWYLLLLLSSLLMGIETVIAKSTLRKEYATEFSAAITPLVFLLSLVFIPLANFNITLFQLAFVIFQSALGAYTYLLSARVFRHGDLSVASPAFSSLPTLLVVILSFFFLQERLNTPQYISIIGMTVAAYMLFFRMPQKKDRLSIDAKKFYFMIFLYVTISAAGTVMNKYTLYNMNPYTYLILSGFFMSVFFMLLITVKYKGVSEVRGAIKKYKFPLVANAFLTLGYRVAYYVALVVTPASIAQPFRNVFYVVITVVLGCLLFKEEGLWKKLALSILMLFFAYLLTL